MLGVQIGAGKIGAGQIGSGHIGAGQIGAGQGWALSAWLLAGLAGVPLLAILVSLPQGGLAAWRMLGEGPLALYAMNSAALMALTGVMATLMGTAAAWLVTAARFPGRKVCEWMLILPLAVPPYIAAYIYADLLDFAGPVQSGLRGLTGWGAGDYSFPAIRSLFGGALILSLVLYPYVYLLARASFAAQSLSQFRAARSLGLSPRRAFWRVALPAARPAIAGGAALVAMETLADFGVAEYYGIPTFSTGIFRSWLVMGDKAAALKLASIMLVFVMALIWLERRGRKGRVETHDRIDTHNAHEALIELSRAQSIGAIAVCALPVLLGFIVPAGVLLLNTLHVADSQHGQTLWSYVRATITLGAMVATVAMIGALILAYAQKHSSGILTRAAIRLATLGYALPGALLAVGLLAPLGAFDLAISRAARDHWGWSEGLILTGTSAVLVYALSVRFLTISFNTISAGMEKLPARVDDAARSLGAGSWRVLKAIHLPQLRFSLAACAGLVFIDTLRELPATLILRPFNLETLATRVYRLASDERLAEASSAALLILVAGLIPVLLLSRAQR